MWKLCLPCTALIIPFSLLWAGGHWPALPVVGLHPWEQLCAACVGGLCCIGAAPMAWQSAGGSWTSCGSGCAPAAALLYPCFTVGSERELGQIVQVVRERVCACGLFVVSIPHLCCISVLHGCGALLHCGRLACRSELALHLHI